MNQLQLTWTKRNKRKHTPIPRLADWLEHCNWPTTVINGKTYILGGCRSAKKSTMVDERLNVREQGKV